MKRERAEHFLNHLRPLQRRVEGYARRALWDAQAVPDVLQSAIAAAFRDFDLYAEGTNFRAWIFAYVHREIQNANRRQIRHKHDQLSDDVAADSAGSSVDDEPRFTQLVSDPDAVLDQCDAALAECIRALRPLERSAMLLHAIGEFKYREIAEILQVPIGTVMSALFRARGQLRRQLAEFGVQQGLLKGKSH